MVLSQSVPTALVRYNREDFAASYAIGNTPWLSAASDMDRISRITTTYQKERIDQSSSAGENSLSNWWIRSATSWHRGAGELYYDADADDLYMFHESNNIDVWTSDQISLLPATTNVSTSNASYPSTSSGGTFFLNTGSNVYYYNSTTSTTTSASLGAGVTAQVMTSDGYYALVGASNGVYQVNPSTMAVTKLWSKPTSVTAWTVQAIGYVKDRIVIGVKEDSTRVVVYELGRNPNSPPQTVGVNEERWTYTGTVVTFNSIGELNSAIMVAYTIGAVSRVQGYNLDPASPLAALLDPSIIAELPRGETINQIRSYLNTYVVIATNQGLRIGTQDSAGQGFSYGQLIIHGSPVKDIAFNDSYVYATRAQAIDSHYGLWRIDLGTTSSNGTIYAYASDLETDEGTVNGVAFLDNTNRKFITSSSGIWIEEAVKRAQTGWLTTGRVRWGTQENKQPVSLTVRTGDATSSSVGVSVYDNNGVSQLDIDSIPLGNSLDIGISNYLSPGDFFELKFTLSRDELNTTTAGPTLEQWSMRALPAPLRSRTFTIPLLCYEEERDSNGYTVVSNPWERINYLERIEQTGGAVLFQDFSTKEERICIIRAIQFEQKAPPSYARGFGGIVTLQLQTIDYEQPIT
jgi:hypothetical protein